MEWQYRNKKELVVLLHKLLTKNSVPDQRIRETDQRKERTMLWTIFVILMIMWLLGMVSSYTLGGYIHLLLIIAIAVVLIRVIQGRTPI